MIEVKQLDGYVFKGPRFSNKAKARNGKVRNRKAKAQMLDKSLLNEDYANKAHLRSIMNEH